jgi:hypothetical protein
VQLLSGGAGDKGHLHARRGALGGSFGPKLAFQRNGAKDVLVSVRGRVLQRAAASSPVCHGEDALLAIDLQAGVVLDLEGAARLQEGTFAAPFPQHAEGLQPLQGPLRQTVAVRHLPEAPGVAVHLAPARAFGFLAAAQVQCGAFRIIVPHHHRVGGGGVAVAHLADAPLGRSDVGPFLQHRLAGDRLQPIRAVEEHQRLGVVAVANREGNAFLRQQALDEVQVALVVLGDGVAPRRRSGEDPALRGQARLVQHLLHHLAGGLLLEQAHLLAQFQQVQPRSDLQPDPEVSLLVLLHAGRGDDPMEAPPRLLLVDKDAQPVGLAGQLPRVQGLPGRQVHPAATTLGQALLELEAQDVVEVLVPSVDGEREPQDLPVAHVGPRSYL